MQSKRSFIQQRVLSEMREGKALFAFMSVVSGLNDVTLTTTTAQVVFLGNPIKRTVHLATLHALLLHGTVAEAQRVLLKEGIREGVAFQCWRIEYCLSLRSPASCQSVEPFSNLSPGGN